jgi:toxin ParE1/3/4
MAEYRLTERARADLLDIYDFTESRFGAYQADAYYAGLIRSLGHVEIRAVIHGSQDIRPQLFE